jgi:hypothetical protein
MTIPDQNLDRSESDTPVGERVYAPASARVPVDPVPGHHELTDHPDTHTPERQAASAATSTPDPYASNLTNPGYTPYNDAGWNTESRSSGLPFGLGWVALGIGGGLGGWLYLRWQRERNKPINRLRRQALQAAGELRNRVPSPEEAVRPAAGVTTALLSIAVILYRLAQSRSQQADKVISRQTKKAGKRADKTVSRASHAMSEIDLQKRLSSLKKRWDPSRLELEKIQISRH